MKLSVAQRDHDMQVVEDLCAGLRQLGISGNTQLSVCGDTV